MIEAECGTLGIWLREGAVKSHKNIVAHPVCSRPCIAWLVLFNSEFQSMLKVECMKSKGNGKIRNGIQPPQTMSTVD